MDYGPHITVKINGRNTVVELNDQEILDESTIDELADALFRLVADNPMIRMTLCFDKVNHLSSSALGTLIRLNKRVEDQDGQLKLCEIKAPLREIFVITKLNKLFDIFDDRVTAMKSF